jgi:anaerobic magnesium-protoporphyrin IX monomethyl ester cyclase
VNPMEFTFISPAAALEDLDERKEPVSSWPPLGMLYIATILAKEGFEVSLLDQAAKGLTIAETARWVKKENPDIVGFSTLASSGRTAALTAREIKKENPDAKIVFGNYYATFNTERVLQKYPWVDIIVRGEGEITSLELAKRLKNGESLKNVLGITFREKNKVISTPDRPLIKDVDALPFPERELIDVEYHSEVAGAVTAPEKFTTVLSSRGCPFRCRFCGCQRFARGVWRARSAENTVKEISLLASMGYKQFLFVDDSFTINPKRVTEICRQLRREKVDMDWICEGRVDYCSYETMREMVKAGCKNIYFGIESANQRILDYYDKRITPQQSEKAVKTTRKACMDSIMASFIVGAPTETREEIENTLNFARKIPIDFPQFNILGVFPGMDIWEEFKAKGVLKEEEYWETGAWASEMSPDTLPPEEIKRLIEKHFNAFIMRPKYMLKEIAYTLKSWYRINIVVHNVSRLGSVMGNIATIAKQRVRKKSYCT